MHDADCRRSHRVNRPGARTRLLCAALWMGLACVAVDAQAATVYLCKAYSGGQFWSNTVCSKQQALIERMVTVPDDMSWDQQVQLADQSRAEAAKLTAPRTVTTTNSVRTYHNGIEGKAGECQSLANSIQQFESMSRQPQTGQVQDWITARKREARDRQFQLRC